MATLLQKFVDVDQWEAEDLVGRLGLIAHAAFLHAGFRPYGAEPPSGHLLKHAGDTGSSSRSRSYTAPQLALGEDAEAAVLMVWAAPGSVALLMHLTTDRRLRRSYRQHLDAATMAALLSRRLDDTEPWGSRICWSLADGPCWRLLVELCRRNGLPLTGFASLPEDVVVEILKRVDDGADLARAACTCRLLSRLVAEGDTELWKPLYEQIVAAGQRPWWSGNKCSFLERSERAASSWKVRYVKYVMAGKWLRLCLVRCRSSSPVAPPLVPSRDDFPPPPTPLDDPPEPERIGSLLNIVEGRRRRKLPLHGCNRERHAAGAVQYSRHHRWRHR